MDALGHCVQLIVTE